MCSKSISGFHWQSLASCRRFALTRAVRAVFVSLLILSTGCVPAQATALGTVTLQLKWTHAFQFAGYYAAKELGYYRDAGLDVDIVEAPPGRDPLDSVLEGRAQFGVGTCNLLLARQAGHPVVVLAVIYQHSPLVLVARQNHALRGVHDLVDKRVMIEPQSQELLACLKQEGVPVERLDQVVHSHDSADLIRGDVDAMSAYVTHEPFYLDHAGLPYQVHTPRTGGIDFYGDNLFTTEQEIARNPARV